jgi:predicted nucleotidyltransferase
MSETPKYSTKEQRKRVPIVTLNERLEAIKRKHCDDLRYDRPDMHEGMRTRAMAWLLGGVEFHLTYHETPEAPHNATVRIRTQPYAADGVKNNWIDVPTLGELDDLLRGAKAQKLKTKNDLEAAKGTFKHDGATPKGLILVGLSGSHAYGLNHNGFTDADGNLVPPSDIDTRGLFVLPTKEVLSLGRHKELVEQKSSDTKFDEVERFIALCLSCNPERLEMLAVARKHMEKTHKTINQAIVDSLVGGKQAAMTMQGRWLVENQKMFLSKKVIKTYGGYAKQQLYRIESKKERQSKPAMHLIRLLITGIRMLETGVVDCNMSEYREQMLDIRKGVMPMDEVFAWHRELEAKFAKAAEQTDLPEEPDTETANEILLEIRRAHLDWSK